MENKLKQYFPIIQQIYFYGSIKGVYTIVLFEKSPVQFHKYPDVYTKPRLAGADDQPDYRVPEVQSHVRAFILHLPECGKDDGNVFSRT